MSHIEHEYLMRDWFNRVLMAFFVDASAISQDRYLTIFIIALLLAMIFCCWYFVTGILEGL